MTRRLPWIALSMALAAPPGAGAQTTEVEVGGFTNRDPDAPVEITSDRLDLKRFDGTALFTGDVLAVQGEMRLRAEWVLVEYVTLEDGSLGNEIERVTARENVLLVTPTEAAEGNEGIYTPLTNKVVIRGDVLLTQGPNTIAGDAMEVDLETGIGEVTGRVRTVLQQDPSDAAQ